jgi:phage terminase Nu1 subunit (DNA packaging protein)
VGDLWDGPVTQETFASIVGISQPRVAQLIAEGVITDKQTLRAWIRTYCERLRETAAGRGQELTIERAKLARSQRVGQELKNAEVRGELAPIGLLTDVLGLAAAAVASRLNGLKADMRRVCPELPEPAWQAIETAIAQARNQWARQTESLVQQAVDELDAAEEDEYSDIDGLAPAPAGEPEDGET